MFSDIQKQLMKCNPMKRSQIELWAMITFKKSSLKYFLMWIKMPSDWSCLLVLLFLVKSSAASSLHLNSHLNLVTRSKFNWTNIKLFVSPNSGTNTIEGSFGITSWSISGSLWNKFKSLKLEWFPFDIESDLNSLFVAAVEFKPRVLLFVYFPICT